MASSETLLVFDPLSNRPPATDFASVDLRGEFVVLDFDAATNEVAQFHAIVPSHYSGGDLTAVLTWASSTATSGNARLKVELTRLGTGVNLDALPAPDGSAELAVSAPSTSGDLAVDSADPVAVSGLTPGDTLRVAVTRLATDAADTMAGDLELVSLELREA
jgi:hypothetical protein